jgi:transcriptional regulator with XRE-family HTH domain
MKAIGRKSQPASAPPPKDPVLSALARNLRLLRQARGLSQTALAELVRMSRARLNQIEHAKEDPRLSTVARIARALKVSTARLVQ